MVTAKVGDKVLVDGEIIQIAEVGLVLVMIDRVAVWISVENIHPRRR